MRSRSPSPVDEPMVVFGDVPPVADPLLAAVEGEQLLPWLPTTELYGRIDTFIPPEARRAPRAAAVCVSMGPNVDNNLLVGDVSSTRWQKVFLPASLSMLRALYLAVGALYPPDSLAIVREVHSNAPRYNPDYPLPLVPVAGVEKFFFKYSKDKAAGDPAHFSLDPADNVLPDSPSLDPGTLFKPVDSMRVTSAFLQAQENFGRASLRASSYATQCMVAAGRMFQRFLELDRADPSVGELARDIHQSINQATSCLRSGDVWGVKGTCNLALVRRDAHLQTVPSLPTSMRQRLRALPFHDSPYLFAGRVREIAPMLMDDAPQTVSVHISSAPAPSAKRPAFKVPSGPPPKKGRDRSPPRTVLPSVVSPVVSAPPVHPRPQNQPAKRGAFRGPWAYKKR